MIVVDYIKRTDLPREGSSGFHWYESMTPGWYVGYPGAFGEGPLYFDMSFVHQRDAEMARETLLAHKIDTADRAKEVGPERCRQLLVENLRW